MVKVFELLCDSAFDCCSNTYGVPTCVNVTFMEVQSVLIYEVESLILKKFYCLECTTPFQFNLLFMCNLFLSDCIFIYYVGSV